MAHPPLQRREAIPSLRSLAAVHGHGVVEGAPGRVAQAQPGAGHRETRRVKTFAQEKVTGNTGLRLGQILGRFWEDLD